MGFVKYEWCRIMSVGWIGEWDRIALVESGNVNVIGQGHWGLPVGLRSDNMIGIG